MAEYEFIKETLFFPDKGILVVGDLHIGYEHSLMEAGILLPEQQVTEVISNLRKIIEEIKAKKYNLRKVVFLGDIKHFFGYEWKEKANFNKVLDFLKGHVTEKNIILIRGNHDTMDLGLNFKDYHIEKNIVFLHGHKSFPEIYSKEVKIIVTGHLHPSVIISEEPGVKQEMYKCFLVGLVKEKTHIVLPSFLEFYEGTPVNYYKKDFIESFSIIPKKEILKFRIHVVSDDDKGTVYDFGRVRDL